MIHAANAVGPRIAAAATPCRPRQGWGGKRQAPNTTDFLLLPEGNPVTGPSQGIDRADTGLKISEMSFIGAMAIKGVSVGIAHKPGQESFTSRVPAH